MAPPNRLRRWQRLLCDGAGLVLLASGLVWLVVHYAWGAGAGELPHALEPSMMKLHGLAAMAALFAFGSLATSHVPHGLRVTQGRRGRSHRRLGLWLGALAALLVGSGYLLYYFTPENWRAATGLTHSAIGVAMALVLVWHRRRWG
jgi:hypothetical protein